MSTTAIRVNSTLTFKSVSSVTNALAFFQKIVIAGLIGGLCEVFWISIYSVLSDVSLSQVGREITHAVFPSLAANYYAPIMGVAIHFSLSILLALGFITCLWPMLKNKSKQVLFASTLSVLGLIWAFNFFVLLPVINPTFVILMPYTVTLVSKLLFAYGMAMYLHKSR